MAGRLGVAPSPCIVCGAAHATCRGTAPDSAQVLALKASVVVPLRGRVRVTMAIQKPGAAGSEPGPFGMAPGASNARAVRKTTAAAQAPPAAPPRDPEPPSAPAQDDASPKKTFARPRRLQDDAR